VLSVEEERFVSVWSSSGRLYKMVGKDSLLVIGTTR